jgi:predicted MFS family arabinose efflux permease
MQTPPGRAGSEAYAKYVLGVLFACYVFNWVDRNVLAILLGPMKAELGVSDTAMGFLSGLAFAVFYTLLGIPIARWADLGNRRSILAVGIALWSAMTVVCGLARSFTALALARVGVGVGEAAGSPSSHSLISDYFPPARRGRALSVYAMGNYAGHFVAFVIGGWVNEHYGWRTTFFVMGAPGLLLALLVRLTVREPPRGVFDGAAGSEPRASLRDVLRFLGRQRSYVFINLGGALNALVGYGFGIWGPTFFMRVHGMGTAEVGLWLGWLSPLGGLTGTLLGGLLIDRLAGRDGRWYLWIPTVSALASVPVSVLLLLGGKGLALALYGPHALLFALYIGPMFAAMQGVAPPRMRAITVAVHLLIVNLLGLGAGPLVVGALNDFLNAEYGASAVRYSLLLVSISGLASSACFLAGARSVRRDLRTAQGAASAA